MLDAWPASKPRERIAYILAAWCGLRLSELRGLQRQDCHLDGAPWLHVRRAVVRGPSGWAERPTTKSGKDRVLPLPAWIATELRPWAAFERTYLLADEGGLALRGGSYTSALMRGWRKAQDAAGVAPLRRWQDLRSTAATCWQADGVPRTVVKVLLGHSTEEGLGGADVLGVHYERLGLDDQRPEVEAGVPGRRAFTGRPGCALRPARPAPGASPWSVPSLRGGTLGRRPSHVAPSWRSAPRGCRSCCPGRSCCGWRPAGWLQGCSSSRRG